MRKSILLQIAVVLSVALGIGMLTPRQAHGQGLATYQFSNSLGTYTELDLDSVLNNDAAFDDIQYAVAIGFPFKYVNNTYTRLSVSSNGFVKLGSTISNNAGGGPFASGSYNGTMLDNGNADNQIIAGLNMDLVGRDLNGSKLSIQRVGTSPNRSLVIQWQDMHRFTATEDFPDVDSLDFQIALFEDGHIEVRYGRMVASSALPGSAQVGLRGNNRNQIFSLTGTDLDSAARSTSSTANITFSDQTLPDAGRIYRFTPPPPAALDAAAVQLGPSIDPRGGCRYSTQETVTLRVRNAGTTPMSSATVGVSVNGTVRTQQINFNPALGLREEAVVNFSGANGFDLSQYRSYVVAGFITLPGDTIHNNDTVRTAFRLRAPATVPGLQSVANYNQLRTRGWIQGEGTAAPGDSILGNWDDDQFDFPNTLEYYVFDAATNGWLYRPGLKATEAVGIRFKVAVTDAFSTFPAESLYDDSLKVVVRSCAGGNWQTIASFSQGDLTAGIIGNTFNEFTFQFAPDSGVYSVGFVVDDNGTSALNSYMWRLDDLEFISTRNLQADLKALNLSIAATGSSGCAPGTVPVSLIIRNTGVQPIAQAQTGLIVNGVSRTPQTLTFTPPLPAGQNRIVSLTGASGLDLSQFGTYQIRGYVSSSADSIRNNDTVRVTFVLRAPTPVPGPTPVVSLADSRAKGWEQSDQGDQAPGDTTSGVWEAEAFNYPNSIYYYVDAFGSANQTAWLYRPGLSTNGQVGLRFKLAVSETFSSTATTDVDDDTLKVVVSSDCGSTWRVIAKFSDADVTSGRINNQLKTFVAPFAAASGTYSVGFHVDCNNTLGSSSYRWHLDNIEFVTGVNLSADSALQPALPPNRILGNCSNQALPISAVVTNQGLIAVDTVVLGYRYNSGPIRTQTFLTHLEPLQRDTLTFDQANLTVPAATGVVTLKIFTINRQDSQGSNDTVRVQFIITPAQPMPGSTLLGFNAVIGAGYTQAVSRQAQSTSSNLFAEGTSFGLADRTVAYTASTANLADRAAWIISPMYSYAVGASLYFNVAVTSGTTGTGAIANIGTDSLKVMYRVRCGAWQQLAVFTQADLASGAISNRLQGKGYQAPNAAPDSIQFAFEVARGATAAPATYRWHINKIRSADEPLATRPSLSLPNLTLAPVPAHSRLEVAFGKRVNASLRVTDLSGRSIITKSATGTETSLNVSGLKPGLYMLIIDTAEGRATRAFTVE